MPSRREILKTVVIFLVRGVEWAQNKREKRQLLNEPKVNLNVDLKWMTVYGMFGGWKNSVNTPIIFDEKERRSGERYCKYLWYLWRNGKISSFDNLLDRERCQIMAEAEQITLEQLLEMWEVKLEEANVVQN